MTKKKTIDIENLRTFPGCKPRIETGPVRFGTDWPGVFIRGDNAFYFSTLINGVLTGELSLADPLVRGHLDGLAKTLDECVIK